MYISPGWFVLHFIQKYFVVNVLDLNSTIQASILGGKNWLKHDVTKTYEMYKLCCGLTFYTMFVGKYLWVGLS